MKKKVLVIGAGMAGLSASTYLAMNGYDVEIFELNRVPGGLCTAWQRGDYTIDLCIHWLVGTGSANSFYNKWNELTPMEDIQVKYLEEYLRVEDVQGNSIRLFSDVDRLEQELLEKAPEDKEKILELTHAIRKLSSLNLLHEKAEELTNLWERAREFSHLLPYIGVLDRFMNITLARYASEFSNPLLQKAIFHSFDSEVPAIFTLLNLAWISKHQAGYPLGGSMPFAQKILDHFLELGGKIHYDSRVTKVLVENDRAVGIERSDGSQFKGDYVVSAADGHSTLFEMLEGRYLSREFKKFYEKEATFPSLVFCAFGINRDLSDLSPHILYPLHRSLVIDPETIIDELAVRIHHFDPSLAPKGKTVVTCNIQTFNYKYWENLQVREPVKYQSEKMRISKALIDELDLRFGNIANHVDMIDVATPSTFIHFTHNWRGSVEGWLMTSQTTWKNLPHTLPKLNGFYMCGQWISIGGGLPNVMQSGRDVAQLICHEDEKPFQIHTMETHPELLSKH